MSGRKLRKSIWVPVCLAVYMGVMTWLFAPGLLAEGQATKLWVSVVFEAVIIVGVFFAFRRKERLSGYWNQKKEHH